MVIVRDLQYSIHSICSVFFVFFFIVLFSVMYTVVCYTNQRTTNLAGVGDVAVGVVEQGTDSALRQVVRPLGDVPIRRHPRVSTLELLRHLVHDLLSGATPSDSTTVPPMTVPASAPWGGGGGVKVMLTVSTLCEHEAEEVGSWYHSVY